MTSPRLPDEGGLPQLPEVLPVLPLEEVVVFPFIILPLSVGSDESVAAIDYALAGNRLIMLVAQKESVESPGVEHLHEVGTAGMIMRMLKLPDGRMRVLVQGLMRARIEQIGQREPFLMARVAPLGPASPEAGVAPPAKSPSAKSPPADSPPGREPQVDTQLATTALMRSVRDHLEKALHLGKNISTEVMVVAANLDDPGRLADLVASNLELPTSDAQKILETEEVVARLELVNDHLVREIDLLEMQHQISNQAQEEIDRSQREYYLRQQLKAIQVELGEGEDFVEEIAGYRRLAVEKTLSEEATEELEKQIRRLERAHPDSAENTVIRTYLDCLTGLPWGHRSEDRLDLDRARDILEEDHYGLERVKERILEMLAVRKLEPGSRGPILCFVGPPGVGKTSLGRSIARALDRELLRLSLGGVRDEAEIRGHRRTYVGALPGRILQGLRRAGTDNPVFMLDEVDKLASDGRSDPSAALLEVLDPEQNSAFRDHYLGLAYDLSSVLFITTANLLDPIQPAFRDRMEIVRLSGYSEYEKLAIAQRHLIPKQLSEHGLSEAGLRFTTTGLEAIIRGYTREAGLRNLEREIASICRKVAVRLASGRRYPKSVDPGVVKRFLGVERHFGEELLDRDRLGVATGLAWTAAGGDLMIIEVAALPGEGKLILTGQLGEVMKESGQIALSCARSWASDRGLDDAFFRQHDFHVHAPAGAIPKDGPSAGITIITAIVSLLRRLPVVRTLAMTGEITLRGEILPVGGLREKILAARTAGIETLLIPKANRRDLQEIPSHLLRGLTMHFPGHLDEALELALRSDSGTEPAAGRSRRAKG